MSMWWQLALSRSFTFGQVIMLTATHRDCSREGRCPRWTQRTSELVLCSTPYADYDDDARRIQEFCQSGRSAPDSNTRGRSTETLPSYPLIYPHKFNYTKYPADDYNMQSRPWPLCDLCDRIGPPNLGGLQIPDRNFFLVTISGVFRN